MVDVRKFPQGQAVTQHGVRHPGIYLDEVEAKAREVVEKVVEEVKEVLDLENPTPTVEVVDTTTNLEPLSTENSSVNTSVPVVEMNTTQMESDVSTAENLAEQINQEVEPQEVKPNE